MLVSDCRVVWKRLWFLEHTFHGTRHGSAPPRIRPIKTLLAIFGEDADWKLQIRGVELSYKG